MKEWETWKGKHGCNTTLPHTALKSPSKPIMMRKSMHCP